MTYSRLSLLIPTVLLLSGTAMAMPLSTQDKPTTTNRAELSVPLREAGIFIRGGCPYNLDKACVRNRRGKLICHCVS
jgi:hypothetical protein